MMTVSMKGNINVWNEYTVRISRPDLAAWKLMARRSDRAAGVPAEEGARPFLPWLGRACRLAREERNVVQVKIAAAIEVNQATIARFEDGTAWPRRPEEVLMAYASELDMDVRLLWVHAFVLWLEHEPVLDKGSQEQIRAALKRLKI
jgi:transcriptional regulator with XRE-family HTH domain